MDSFYFIDSVDKFSLVSGWIEKIAPNKRHDRLSLQSALTELNQQYYGPIRVCT